MSGPIAQVPLVEVAHEPETFAERFARLGASIPPPPRQSGFFLGRSSQAPNPLSLKRSEYSINASNKLRRKQFIEDLKNKETLLKEASYIRQRYSGSYNKQLRIGDDTKINDIIKALQKRKADENNTTEYDEMLKQLQEIRRKISSVWEGGKRRKTRRKRRRTTRSSK